MKTLFYQKYNFQFLFLLEDQKEMCGVVFLLIFSFLRVKLKTPPLVQKSALLALKLLVLVPQQGVGGSLMLSQVVVVHCFSSKGD